MICSSCGTTVADGARFCEACGAPVADAAGTVLPPAPPLLTDDPMDDAPISAPTRKPAGALLDPVPQGRRPCGECGGEVGPDLYCLECGTKAPSARDHIREQPAAWVAGVCDKALKKSRNEDAMALLASDEPGTRAVLIVMDGVSNSIDSDTASLAGAQAAREVLRMPLPAGMGTPEGRTAAVNKVLTNAAAAANTAIVAVTDPDSTNPASATFTAVVLEGAEITVGSIGDSRAYWIPDAGEPVLLTTDDSVAQMQIAAGVDRVTAETGPQAHAITKWLGRDSEDITPTITRLEIDAPGWLLACTDGLWNYASEPEALAEEVRAAATTDPTELAVALVAFANGAGGHDNITAAVARVDLGQNAEQPTTATTSINPEPSGAPATPGGEPSHG